MKMSWQVAAALLVCACAAPPARQADEASPEPSDAAPVTAPSAPAPRGLTAEDVLAIAPELTARSATRLLEIHGGSGPTAEMVAEAGLATAAQGFRTFDEEMAREVGALLDRAYGTLTAHDRATLGAYLDRVRSGSTSPDEARAGHRLFAQAVASLDAERRSRLALLIERGLFAGLQYEVDARARTLAAKPIDVAVMAGPQQRSGMAQPGPRVAEVPPGAVPQAARESGFGAPKGRGEAYWRAEADRRRTKVTSLERELEAAILDGARYIYPPDTNGQIGFGTPTPDPFYVNREKANARIAQLKTQLAAAKQRLSDLDDEARRDYAMPGWLR
jgi:hypothetical protein